MKTCSDQTILVSVIVPIYNVEQYLEHCILSLVNQNYKLLEIILIDDGSTDSSGEICEKWLQKDSRIHVIHKKNEGLSAARNTGIVNSHGEFITFVDSDDYVHKDYINNLLDACLKNKVKLAIGKLLAVTDDNPTEWNYDNESSENEILSKEELFLQLFSSRNVETVVACGKIYHRSLWKDLRFPLGRIHEDAIIVQDIFNQIQDAAWVNRILYYYRSNLNSITQKKYNLQRLDELYAYERRLSLFHQNKWQMLFQKQLYVYLSRIIYHYQMITKMNNITKIERNEIFKLYNKYLSSISKINKTSLDLKHKVKFNFFRVYFLIKQKLAVHDQY